MKKLFILPLCLLAFAACESRQRQPAPQNALAAAAGAYITQEDFDKKAAQYDADFQKFIATEPGRQNFLNFLINDAILNAAARDSGIADSAAYKEEIEALKAQQAQAFKERQEMLLKELFTKKLLEDGTTAVSEEEIRAYHRRYPYQIRLLHILLPDAAQAERVMRNMGRSPNRAEFEAAAKRYSIDPQTKTPAGSWSLLSPANICRK
ncbi:MAG: hypothetical protein LBR90_04345 [Elusimicrobiota bacterium]|jgi:parvulin-like peptidyl-prolyl isomerase|nr:hypothetical protein [Elusimicrobiota bacterium]